MRVRYRKRDKSTYSAHEALYVSPSQLFLTELREYEVHAISVYDGITFVLVADDKDTPTFRPRILFEVVNAQIPDDWICNIFPSGPVQLVIGPDFVAKDLASYDAMVDQRLAQVEGFWRRVAAKGR